MRIKQNFFSGERPRMTPNLLKEYEAQIAQNCNLTRGDIRPLKSYSREMGLSETGTLRSLYHWETDSGNHWIANANDLDFARSPIAGEAHDRVYVTGMAEPRVLTTSILSTPFSFLTDFYKLGVPAPVSAPTLGGSYVAASDYRAYIYTYVVTLAQTDAEEGPNSPIAEITDYASGNVEISGFVAPPTGRSIGKIRVYRTSSSTSGVTEFRYVGEFSTDGIDFSSYIFTDNVLEADLALDVLVTENFTPPPADLKGLISIGSGSLAGFVGNRVYVSEPYLPHAWPYSYPVDANIIGLGLVGTYLIVLTDEFPYMMTGYPEAMQTQKFSVRYPCVSKTGISFSDLGTLYPSHEGIVQVTHDGPSLLTYEYFTEQQNQDNYFPNTIRSVYDRGRHICFHVGGAFAIDLRDKTLVRMNDPVPVTAAHVSLSDNNLYFIAVDDDGSGGNAIYRFEGDTLDLMQYTYRSKEFMLPNYSNMAAARLLIDIEGSEDITTAIALDVANQAINAAVFVESVVIVGPTGAGSQSRAVVNGNPMNALAVNGDGMESVTDLSMDTDISFKLYAEGDLIHTETVTGDTPFRLPAGLLYKRCYFEVIGYVPVREVAMAPSMEELDA